MNDMSFMLPNYPINGNFNNELNRIMNKLEVIERKLDDISRIIKNNNSLVSTPNDSEKGLYML